jgi:hypothetical protein
MNIAVNVREKIATNGARKPTIESIQTDLVSGINE